MLTELVNRLADAPDEVFLVLDDYHLVDAPDIAEGMAFLLEKPAAAGPPRAQHAVRPRPAAEPDARPRRGRRGARLRPALHRPGSRQLPATAPVSTSTRPIWRSWRSAPKAGRPHSSWRRCPCGTATTSAEFIADFAGDDRFIVDYLVEEVLTRQPEPSVSSWSAPRSSSGSPAHCATQSPASAAAATHAAGAGPENLFVVPLDGRRRWYRYHHLFADVLRTHLATGPGGPAVAELHGRASRWYESDGQHLPAVSHALAAGDQDRAAALMEVAIPDLLRLRQEATVSAGSTASPTRSSKPGPCSPWGSSQP